MGVNGIRVGKRRTSCVHLCVPRVLDPRSLGCSQAENAQEDERRTTLSRIVQIFMLLSVVSKLSLHIWSECCMFPCVFEHKVKVM